MYGYIYLTTNLINGRKYIGQHKSEQLDESYKGSGKILLQAMEKYGFDNFSCEIIEECTSKEDMDEKEAYYIALSDAVNSREFYNLTPGGLGRSVKGVVYITNGEVNKKVPPEELDYYYSIGFHKGGPKPTKEVVEKRRQSNIGKEVSQLTRDRISYALKGKPLSEEHRMACSEGGKGKKILSLRKKVRCVETGEIYDCLSDATRAMGGAKSNAPICNAIKRGTPSYGYHWEHI